MRRQTEDHAPAGGGGGGGGMPLLIWMVMIEPGTVCPVGEVPTTVPAGEVLLTGCGLVGDLETGLLQPLAGQVLAHAATRWAPANPAAVDVRGSVGGSATTGVRW